MSTVYAKAGLYLGKPEIVSGIRESQRGVSYSMMPQTLESKSELLKILIGF